MPDDSGKLLALDLGGVTGWALAEPGAHPMSGSYRVPGERGDAAYFDNFMGWLADMITINRPRLLVYEAPILTAGKTSAQTALRLMGMTAITLAVAHRRKVRRIEPANNSTVKKHVCGSGRADKLDMLAEMRRRGWEPRDEHAADALGVLLWAEATFAKGIVRSAGRLFASAAP